MMSCFHPVLAIYRPVGSPIFCLHTISGLDRTPHIEKGERWIYLPCGNCLGCRVDRRMEKTILQACEASMSKYENWFITLTYDDSKCNFPVKSLNKEHIQDFNEHMRKYMQYHGLKWRFYGCGEYGDIYKRPHYHLSVFDIPDEVMLDNYRDESKVYQRGLDSGKFVHLSAPLRDENGNEYWRSSVISKRWKYGNVQIYRACKETYQYVAGYVVKKLTGIEGDEYYKKLGIIPEFQFQSRPSIGRSWFDKYWRTLSTPYQQELINDVVSIAGMNFKVPRIFGKWIDSLDQFDGPEVRKNLSAIRSLAFDISPNWEELKRKKNFMLYKNEHFKLNNNHKEIQ